MVLDMETFEPGSEIEMEVSSMKFIKGDKGDDGVGIANAVFDSEYRLVLTLTDGSVYISPVLKGEDGKVTEEELERAVQEVQSRIHIPVNISELVNDLNYTTQSWVENQHYFTQEIAYTKEETDDKIHELNQWVVNEFANVDESLAGKESIANKTETITGTNIDTTHYPSVKAITDWVYDRVPSTDEKSYWNAKADISDVEEVETTLHSEIQLVGSKIPTKLNQLEDDATHRTVTDAQIESWSHAPVDVDNVTITKTSDNKLQAVATNLVSGGYQNYWVGTKNEYNAIAEKNPNTFYEVLDDEESALFEVDGTSIEFSPDKILRVPNNIDLMYQSMLYGGGESGYRKYRNGCLEQWGVATSSANGEAELSMHQPHIDTNFSIFVTPRERGNFFWYALPTAQQRFAVRIQSRDSQSMAVLFQWRSWGRWK